MKLQRIILFIAAIHFITMAAAESRSYKFTEASQLNLIGKIHDNTPNPYHRVDTCIFKGFTKGENIQVRCSAGLAVLFKTNSEVISVKSDYGYTNMSPTTMGVALRGFDLYIKKDGDWLYAGSKCPDNIKNEQNVILVDHMDKNMKECLLYLPMYSEMKSVKIGIEDSAEIFPLESPFKHRIGIFGSSFTQGIGVTRSGMTYPMQFMRNTGLQILSLGCSGNCKLQSYFADVLNAAELDAIIFDAFSNPSAETIKEKLFPFIEKIQSVHPDIPLIFMQTIYRQYRNFNHAKMKQEEDKEEMARKLMAEAAKKYQNVYFITPDTGKDADLTSVDGIHPSDMGYMAWARSIQKPIIKILKKYNIQ